MLKIVFNEFQITKSGNIRFIEKIDPKIVTLGHTPSQHKVGSLRSRALCLYEVSRVAVTHIAVCTSLV